MSVQYILKGTPDRIMARLKELSLVTDVPGQITRTFVSPASMKAAALVGSWMKEAGMSTFIDAAGSIRGRLAGTRPDLPAVMLGSHLDTVINAGAYDGTLGVLSAIEAVDRLVKAGKRPEHSVEIAGFSDEEGTRFGVTYLGSAAMAGRWDPAWFDAVDRDGITLRDAMLDAGLSPEKISEARIPEEGLCAYYELHIEQGPVLKKKDRSLACVTCISHCRRFDITVTGETGHAGTVPVSWRHDAMLGACAVIGAIEKISRKYGDSLFCTVGTIACAQHDEFHCAAGQFSPRHTIPGSETGGKRPRRNAPGSGSHMPGARPRHLFEAVLRNQTDAMQPGSRLSRQGGHRRRTARRPRTAERRRPGCRGNGLCLACGHDFPAQQGSCLSLPRGKRLAG